jgi:hypothetical protein
LPSFLTWRSIVCYLLFKKNPQTKSCDLETARDLIVQYCETPGISFDGSNSGTHEGDNPIGRCCNGDEASEACARNGGGSSNGRGSSHQDDCIVDKRFNRCKHDLEENQLLCFGDWELDMTKQKYEITLLNGRLDMVGTSTTACGVPGIVKFF